MTQHCFARYGGCFSLSEHIFKCKLTQKQAKRRLHHHPPHKFRHLVEEREEKWRFFREERKAV